MGKDLRRSLNLMKKTTILCLVAALTSVVMPFHAAIADANALRQPVLRPESFFGKAKLGYEAAQQTPEICAKLFCYCGCDMTDNHSSLLDCFTSDHGVDCSICQEETIIALKMKNEHKSLAEIQKVIDLKYTKDYEATFSKPTDALRNYRANRLWQPDKATQTTAPAPEKNAAKPKLEHRGCCSNNK
ncbi:MAG: CYCXC family (seleno)protein [Candidatus Obscuribacterales bacterium]|nr:CYCXC family (seleno)protein [Candidatus Obscuribacterales bacterium]